MNNYALKKEEKSCIDFMFRSPNDILELDPRAMFYVSGNIFK